MVAFYSVTLGDLEAASTQPLQHEDKLKMSRSVYPMQNKAGGTGAINRCGGETILLKFSNTEKNQCKKLKNLQQITPVISIR
jgi:hypothetical protein